MQRKPEFNHLERERSPENKSELRRSSMGSVPYAIRTLALLWTRRGKSQYPVTLMDVEGRGLWVQNVKNVTARYQLD